MITSGPVCSLIENEEMVKAAWNRYAAQIGSSGHQLSIHEQAILMTGFRAGWNGPLMVLLEEIIRKEDLQ